MSKPTVVVVGANGFLGAHVIKALLSAPFRSLYTLPIRVVTRDSSKVIAKVPGAEADVKFYSADVVSGAELDTAFNGADVVVNLLGVSFSHNKVADAAAAANAKLYIPSEFGLFIKDAGEFKDVLAVKSANISYARGLGLKSVAVSIGAFTEFVYTTPIFGVNAPSSGEFLYYGDLDTKTSVTSLADVGKAVASLGAKDPSTIPDDVIIAGDTLTLREIPETIKKISGKELKLVGKPLEEITTPALKVVHDGPKSVADFLTGLKGAYYSGRFYAEGKDNEFVSKGLFEFTSFEKAGEVLLKN